MRNLDNQNPRVNPGSIKTLIVLVGIPGCGKSTYCKEKLKGYTRISQDDMGKSGHQKAFQKAIADGDEYIVLDRVNHDRSKRRNYIAAAKRAGYYTKIIWFNVDRSLCHKRCVERRGHPTLKPEDADKALKYFTRAFQTPSRKEADDLVIIGAEPPFVKVNDVREEIGDRRYVVVGDVHGCLDELKEMLAELDFDEKEDVLVCVGDLFDRGPKIRETLEFVMSLPRFYCVRGNHDDKVMRYFEGKQVKMGMALASTVKSYDNKMPPEVLDFVREMPYILRLPSGYVVHAGFHPEMSPDEQVRADCLYMRHYGGSSYFDSINGIVWYKLWPQDAPRVFFGHIPEPDGACLPHYVSLDGGCVFGSYLKAWDSRTGIVYYVNAKETYAVNEFTEATGDAPTEDIRRREELVVANLLRSDRSDDGNLVIYTYSDNCVYDNAWDPITTNSRGHIFNVKTGEPVARPFPKFFNLGENPATSPEALPWDQPYDVYEKMDGCLGVLYRHEGLFKVASRGSFHSEYAQWATDFIKNKDLSFLPDEATLCFEMIDPSLRIVLNYGLTSTLVILAAFNRYTGEEYPREAVEEWARQADIPIVKRYKNMTIEHLLEMQRDGKEMEGVVIHFHNGKRVKVKTDWYMTRAKIISRMTPIALWEAMKRGEVQREFLVGVPEEIRPLCDKIRVTLEVQYAKVMQRVKDFSLPLIKKHGGDKKSIALDLQAQGGKPKLGILSPATFMLVESGRNVDALDALIMKEIYPKSNDFVAM